MLPYQESPSGLGSPDCASCLDSALVRTLLDAPRPLFDGNDGLIHWAVRARKTGDTLASLGSVLCWNKAHGLPLESHVGKLAGFPTRASGVVIVEPAWRHDVQPGTR